MCLMPTTSRYSLKALDIKPRRLSLSNLVLSVIGTRSVPVRSTASCTTSMKESDVMSLFSLWARPVLSLSKG